VPARSAATGSLALALVSHDRRSKIASALMKVLAAEDDREILSFVRQGLIEQGFAVDTISNRDEA